MRRALPFPALCFLLEAIGRRPLAPPPGRPASPALRPRRFPHPAWLVPPPPHPVRPPRPPGGGAVALGTQRPRGRPPLGAGFPAETGTPGRTQRRQRPFGGRRGPSACGSSGSEDPSYRPGRAVTAPGGCWPFPWGGLGRPRWGSRPPFSRRSPRGTLRGTQGLGTGGGAVTSPARVPLHPLRRPDLWRGPRPKWAPASRPAWLPRGPCRRRGRHPL